MKHFVVLANFTDQGIRAIKDTTKRAKVFRQMAKNFGGSVGEIFWTLGQYDVVLILRAPSDEVAARIMTKAGSLGNLKSQTLRALTEKEMSSVVAKI